MKKMLGVNDLCAWLTEKQWYFIRLFIRLSGEYLKSISIYPSLIDLIKKALKKIILTNLLKLLVAALILMNLTASIATLLNTRG